MASAILLAIYFVLHLAGSTGNESRLLSDLLWPMALSVGVAATSWLVAMLLTRDAAKAAVLATLIVIAFGVYGYIVQGLSLHWGKDHWDVTPWVFLGLGELLLLSALLVRRSRRSFEAASRFTLLMSSLLLTFALVRVVGQVVRTPPVPVTQIAAAPSPQPAPPGAPDIYLIVLDKYTGLRELADTYGVAAEPFKDSLRRRGFVVPERPRANYVHTFLALAAMLNLRYLDELPREVGENEWSRRPVDPLIEHNRLMATLKSRGYRILFFPTSYPSTRRNRNADVQIPSPERVRPEFFSGWLRLTPLPVVHEYLCKVVACGLDPVRYVPESAEFIDWKLQQLERLPRADRPSFVFLHLMLPHEPYIYDAECRHRDPYWPPTDEGAEADAVKAAYADQVRCVNRKLLHLVRVLQERSRTPPVVILQSDHGHGRLGRHLPSFQEAAADRRSERASVFAAYALPGSRSSVLPDSVTPVNALRYVLREYLGDTLPALEDRTYWSSDRHPYRFVRMAEDGSVAPLARRSSE